MKSAFQSIVYLALGLVFLQLIVLVQGYLAAMPIPAAFHPYPGFAVYLFMDVLLALCAGVAAFLFLAIAKSIMAGFQRLNLLFFVVPVVALLVWMFSNAPSSLPMVATVMSSLFLAVYFSEKVPARSVIKA